MCRVKRKYVSVRREDIYDDSLVGKGNVHEACDTVNDSFEAREFYS